MTPLRRILTWRGAGALVFLGAELAFGPLCAGASLGFRSTGSLLAERSGHTATLLPGGKVLVVEGGVAPGPHAELYDPASESWTTTGSLIIRRAFHTATLLPNGKVLVAGGRSGFAQGQTIQTTSTELYDPASGVWTATGSLVTGRENHTATLLPNGKVLVAGGLNGMTGALASAELYDPTTGIWTATGSLATAREEHTATLLPNGKVLVAGGFGGGRATASAELYDPATGTWSSTGGLATVRLSHIATLLHNGHVLVAGGATEMNALATTELYDSASGTWKATGNLGTARGLAAGTLLPSGKVLIAGGAANNTTLASAELYDPSNGTWSATGSMVDARRLHSVTLLANGQALVAGGVSAANFSIRSAELFGRLTPSMLNISTRMPVLTDDKVLIAGFIITGTDRKTVVARGIGPSLAMSGALRDPVIELRGSSGQLLAMNDNWPDAPSQQQISDNGLAPASELESALRAVIDPGAYTVILRGQDGGTGVGSVEVYDLDQSANSELANLSSRGVVGTGDNVMIGGLIAGGGSPSGAVKVIARALGPSIPVAGALANPTLGIHDQNGNVIAFNDDWKTRPDGSSQQAEIEATTVPPSNNLESSLVRTLSPGNYTAIVRGQDNTSGIGLAEFYHLP